MPGIHNLEPDPSAIGRLRQPSFALLPDPPVLFRQRAERFRVLAQDSALSPYLRFLGALSEIQAELAATLPAIEPVPVQQRERAREHAMPPLDRRAMASSPPLCVTITRFLAAMASVEKPGQAAEALDWLRQVNPDTLDEMIGNVMADAMPVEALPQHLYLSAAIQIEAARLAATLEAGRLVPVGTGLCPVCGSPPVSSLVTGRPGAEGARYAACAFCGTQWNEVRIKCLACGSTKGIGYKEAAGAGETATVKAETCDTCRSWVKILYQDRNPSLEPVADDVASLGLDLLMQDTDYRCAGFDPFLIGY